MKEVKEEEGGNGRKKGLRGERVRRGRRKRRRKKTGTKKQESEGGWKRG